MKTFIVLLVLLLSCSLAYAEYSTLAGVSWTPITKTYSTVGIASGAVVWTPVSGGKINLLGVFMAGIPRNARVSLRTGNVAFDGGTDIIPATEVVSGPIVISSSVPIWRGAVDGNISITSNNSISPSVVLWGYELR